jgi:hypothetical protein
MTFYPRSVESAEMRAFPNVTFHRSAGRARNHLYEAMAYYAERYKVLPLRPAVWSDGHGGYMFSITAAAYRIHIRYFILVCEFPISQEVQS